MKKYLFRCSIILCTLLLGCSPGYVTTRPADVIYTRPVSPGHKYIWISGQWVWTSNHYRWQGGSWQPKREGRTWKSGYWEKSHKGYRWHKGGWE